MSEEEKISISGTVIFQKINIDSKSESFQPFLYVNKGQIIHLFLKDSNPFESNILNQYDGKFITIKGFMKDNTFIVEEFLSS